jgi:hypothetical protein
MGFHVQVGRGMGQAIGSRKKVRHRLWLPKCGGALAARGHRVPKAAISQREEPYLGADQGSQPQTRPDAGPKSSVCSLGLTPSCWRASGRLAGMRSATSWTSSPRRAACQVPHEEVHNSQNLAGPTRGDAPCWGQQAASTPIRRCLCGRFGTI